MQHEFSRTWEAASNDANIILSPISIAALSYSWQEAPKGKQGAQ